MSSDFVRVTLVDDLEFCWIRRSEILRMNKGNCNPFMARYSTRIVFRNGDEYEVAESAEKILGEDSSDD